VRNYENIPPVIQPLPPIPPVPPEPTDPTDPNFAQLLQEFQDAVALRDQVVLQRAAITLANERAREARLADRFGGGWANTGGGNINATGQDQVCRDRTVESLNDIVILPDPTGTGPTPTISHRDSPRDVCRGGP
jgi:hypothetical protein